MDARGCLTPAGMAVLQRAPVGHAPADLAQHVAACGRCQARLLAIGARVGHRPGEATSRAGGVGARGRLWRPVLYFVAALLLAVGALALASLVQRAG